MRTEMGRTSEEVAGAPPVVQELNQGSRGIVDLQARIQKQNICSISQKIGASVFNQKLAKSKVLSFRLIFF